MKGKSQSRDRLSSDSDSRKHHGSRPKLKAHPSQKAAFLEPMSLKESYIKKEHYVPEPSEDEEQNKIKAALD